MSSHPETVLRIFISYRRSDSADYARRIYTWLSSRIGNGAVFLDVEGIEPGDDYAKTIDREIRRSNLVLVIMGGHWNVSFDSDGLSRLEKLDDLVRRELLTAIGSGVRVVPVLVEGAVPPTLDDLPSSLHRLAKLNAIKINENNFDENMLKLLKLAQRSVSDQEGSQNRAVDPSTSASRSMIKQKVVLLGAYGVGKTSLIQRYVVSMFAEKYHTTVGVKIDKKYVRIGDQEVTLMIWDTAGEEEGAPVKINQTLDAHGMIYVVDGCSIASLETALRIRQRFLDSQHELGNRSVPEILAVNKADLQNEWQVDVDKLSSLENSGLISFTTSAKTGKGVELMFSHLARKMIQNHESSGL